MTSTTPFGPWAPVVPVAPVAPAAASRPHLDASAAGDAPVDFDLATYDDPLCVTTSPGLYVVPDAHAPRWVQPFDQLIFFSVLLHFLPAWASMTRRAPPCLATQPVNFAVDDDGIDARATPPPAMVMVATTPTANPVTPGADPCHEDRPHVPLQTGDSDDPGDANDTESNRMGERGLVRRHA